MTRIETTQDFEMFKLIESVLKRKEFKPFLQSFNKNIEASFLFHGTFFPIQFWQDVCDMIKGYYNFEPELINSQLMYYEQLDEEMFQVFLDNLKLPEKYDVTSDKYKYQRDSAYLALKNKIGRIEVGTSGGKTFITYLYCRYALQNIAKDENQKILIIVPSKILAKQLADDFNEYQSLEDDKIIVQSIFSGAKKVQNAQVVCGTYQSLSDYDKDYFDEFMFVVCDELHRAKAYSIKKEIFDKITYAEWFFGMTGTTPAYKTLDYLNIVSMFGGVLVKRDVRTLIDEGISVPVDITVIEIKYLNDKSYSKSLLESGIGGTEKYRAEKHWFQNHPKRNLIIIKLLSHFDSNALILVDTVEYCYLLRDMLKEHFNDTRQIEIINGSVKNRDEILTNMKQTSSGFILIGTYGTMSTGVSIPNIEQLYFVDGGKSEIRIRQSLGRGIRLSPGKTSCKVFDFYDNMQASSFKKHAMYRMSIYKEQQLPFKIKTVNIT